jgi:hypothetical protein
MGANQLGKFGLAADMNITSDDRTEQGKTFCERIETGAQQALVDRG